MHAQHGEPLLRQVGSGLLLKLRDHQKVGVAFLLKCLAGGQPVQQECGGRGAILADGMGLGKTLQAIVAAWAIICRPEHSEQTAQGQKALILCPASLVRNWLSEIGQWLSGECHAVGIDKMSAASVGREIRNWHDYVAPMFLMMSYETFRIHSAHVSSGPLSIVVADEAHRLKKLETSLAKSIIKLCPRRLLLTGTPIQNSLDELYNLMEIANPGVLGSAKAFRI